jgi:hypothetical protein
MACATHRQAGGSDSILELEREKMARIRCVMAVLAIVLAGWLLPAPAGAALLTIAPADDDRGSDTLPLDGVFTCCLFDPGSATVTLGPGSEEALGLEFDISGIPANALITSVTLNLFASNMSSADVALLHGYAGNGVVEGVDLGVSNQLFSFNVPANVNQAPLALNIAPLFIQDLIDGGVGYAGFTLRNTTPGGGVFSVNTSDWGDTSVHPSLAIEFQAIPEPATLFLLGAGLMTVSLRLRRRRR